MKIPPLRDVRYVQCLVLLVYAISAREVFHFERTHLTTLACVGWAVALDLVIGHFWYRKPIFPLSAVILGLAASLLLDARFMFPYLCSVTLGSLSKAFFTYRGRHLFNPGNFGTVIMLMLAPDLVTGIPDLFGGYWIPSLIFFILGMGTVIYARQLEISLSWFFGFLMFGVVRSYWAPMPLINAWVPCMGAGFLLFTFHMISDPATTPKTRKFRILFGLAAAGIDAGFRMAEIPYGSFYALYLATALMPWIRDTEGAPVWGRVLRVETEPQIIDHSSRVE